jgi:hypothetical protein
MTRELTRSYAAIWGATAIGTTTGLLGLQLLATTAPYDALDATPATALALLTANAVVALWPLVLIRLGWHRLAPANQIADLMVRAQILGNGLIAGNALGQHPRLALYLPHLPLEWLAIATPVAAWHTARRGNAPTAIRTATTTLVAVVGAALIETYLVPIA